MNRNCGNCGYYMALKDIERVGKCRRYPPKCVKAGTATSYEFPKTSTVCWCGEHSSGKILKEIEENTATTSNDKLINFLNQETPSAKAARIIAEGLMEDDE